MLINCSLATVGNVIASWRIGWQHDDQPSLAWGTQLSRSEAILPQIDLP